MRGGLQNIPQVPVDEFIFAYSVGGAAASGKTPQSGVAGMGVNLELEGEARRIELADIPINRAMIAVRNQVPREHFQAIVFRIIALNEVLKLPDATTYIRPAAGSENEYEIAEAVFHVAAVMPINAEGAFNTKAFFRRAALKYKELEDG